MLNYIPLRKAVELTGLHPNTLRKYADNGTIPYYRQPNGDRMFDVSKLVYVRDSTIAYARVSTVKQKADLDRQAEILLKSYPNAELIKDIGSGLNFKRKGLCSILERILRGEKLRVVVTYRDRLARFGFDAIEFLLKSSHGEVVVLNQINTSPESELVSDLTAIITIFSSRLHGLRSHQNKKALVKTFTTSETKTEAVDGGISLDFQRDRKTKGERIP